MRFVVRDCWFLWILIFYFEYKEELPSRGEICCPGLWVFMDFDILFNTKRSHHHVVRFVVRDCGFL